MLRKGLKLKRDVHTVITNICVTLVKVNLRYFSPPSGVTTFNFIQLNILQFYVVRAMKVLKVIPHAQSPFAWVCSYHDLS